MFIILTSQYWWRPEWSCWRRWSRAAGGVRCILYSYLYEYNTGYLHQGDDVTANRAKRKVAQDKQDYLNRRNKDLTTNKTNIFKNAEKSEPIYQTNHKVKKLNLVWKGSYPKITFPLMVNEIKNTGCNNISKFEHHQIWFIVRTACIIAIIWPGRAPSLNSESEWTERGFAVSDKVNQIAKKFQNLIQV